MINVIRPVVTSETQSDLEMIPVITAVCGFYSSYSMEVASFSLLVNTTHLQGSSTTSMPAMGWLAMAVAFMLAMGWFAMDAASILGMGWLTVDIAFMLTMEWFAMDGLQCPLAEGSLTAW